MDEAALKKRVDDLLERGSSTESGPRLVTELLHGALTGISAVHGSESHHVTDLRENVKIQKHHSNQKVMVMGALDSLKAELEAGLAGSLQKRMTGDVLTDFIQLSRTALDRPEDGAKNVAAVLAAAAIVKTFPVMTGAGSAGESVKKEVSA